MRVVNPSSATTTIEVGCYKGDSVEGAIFDVRVSAVNMAADGRVLKGQPAARSQYEMCRQNRGGECKNTIKQLNSIVYCMSSEII